MTVIIILAAGGSTRLGRAKQTLPYKNKSLLKHAIDAAVNAGIGPVIIVVGANEEEVCRDLENNGLILVKNHHWKDGMASSIKEGVSYVVKQLDAADNIILMVCDQPYVDEHLLRALVEAKKTSGKTIVACSYKNTAGVPALFSNNHFPELLALKGDEGGKKLLTEQNESVALIPFPHGAIDIDTLEDYEALR